MNPFIHRVDISPNEERPFEGDLFHRTSLARRLSEWVDRLPDGGVLAIDSHWGGGKSWFGRHWRNQLKKDGYRTVWLDAFQVDYIEDPFLLFATEIRRLVSADQERQKTFTEKSVAVGKILVPLLAKSAGRAAIRVIAGEKVEGQVEEALERLADDASHELDEVIRRRLSELESLKNTVGAFRKSLQDIAKQQEQPVVFFVDELDRCRPSFAVSLLERLKHFFEVPGVVFVLLLNRSQLERAIRGTYGEDIDAQLYLQKFITVCVTLPQGDRKGDVDFAFVRDFVLKTGKQLGLDNVELFDDFRYFLALTAVLFQVSYRDLQRVLALYSVADRGRAPSHAIAYLGVLRIIAPATFAALRSNLDRGHVEIRDLIAQTGDRFRRVAPGKDAKFLHAIRIAHRAIADKSLPIDDSGELLLREFFGSSDRSEVREKIAEWSEALDLRVD
jgi:hypothetical protein